MKKTIIIALTVLIFSACADKKAQEKAVLDSVMQIHEKVMGADEQLMKNKMLLDSAGKINSAKEIKDSVFMYLSKINVTDNIMGEWMHKFDPDHTGKSHEETMTYLEDQKKQIMSIDSQLNSVVNQSGKYLSTIKMK
jgi:hypothetical protein